MTQHIFRRKIMTQHVSLSTNLLAFYLGFWYLLSIFWGFITQHILRQKIMTQHVLFSKNNQSVCFWSARPMWIPHQPWGWHLPYLDSLLTSLGHAQEYPSNHTAQTDKHTRRHADFPQGLVTLCVVSAPPKRPPNRRHNWQTQTQSNISPPTPVKKCISFISFKLWPPMPLIPQTFSRHLQGGGTANMQRANRIYSIMNSSCSCACAKDFDWCTCDLGWFWWTCVDLIDLDQILLN